MVYGKGFSLAETTKLLKESKNFQNMQEACEGIHIKMRKERQCVKNVRFKIEKSRLRLPCFICNLHFQEIMKKILYLKFHRTN